MKHNRLTSDNPSLSRATLTAEGCFKAQIAGTCKSDVAGSYVSDQVADLISCSISDNTRRAYQADIAHFCSWGGSIPATPSMVADYIAAHAEELAVATLTRRIATLSKAHEAMSQPNPCRAEIVRATLRGLKRKKGTAQQQPKPLIREDLFLLLDSLGQSPGDIRDRALLLLGFAGGFRRSELTGLRIEDLEAVRQGFIVTLRKSKSDQEGVGRQIGIPHGRTRHCPVAAIDAWITTAQLASGPLFRPVSRHGHVADSPLTGDAVSTILRKRLGHAGLNPLGYSGHSLRAGFATSAAQSGVPPYKIRAQTGHASDAMLARYIRGAEIFEGNAAGALL